MIRRFALALLFLALLTALSGCHNVSRQFRKTVDGVHDLLLEGSG